jgi:hypothetical protein
MSPTNVLLTACLLLSAGCIDGGEEPPRSGSSTTSSPATSKPFGTGKSPPPATIPPAPTDCEEAPQLPACQPGHEKESMTNRL